MQKINILKNRGMSLVEVVVASAIITIFIGALTGAFFLYLQISLSSVDKIKASFLMEEGVEVVRLLAHSDWEENIGDLEAGEDYYLDFDGSSWSMSQTPLLVDQVFDRRVVFQDVYRDGDDRISESGDLDPGTKELTVNISWSTSGSESSQSLTTYITNLSN